MKELGYRYVDPYSTFVSSEFLVAMMIDRELVERECCPECGKPFEYEAYIKDKSYRAFVVCHECNYYEEF